MLPCLLIHDGELADVAELLHHLGLEHVERRGAATAEDETAGWELVVSTPKRLLEFDSGATGAGPTRLAVLEKDSKTLRAMLARAGADLVVRRPVHPAALRLLILHALYRGPEKRRALRVSVGARIRYRAGLRFRQAVLADLSTSGCQLLSAQTLRPDQEITLYVPSEVSAGRGFSLPARVIRSTKSDFPGIGSIALGFGAMKPQHADLLNETIAAYGKGPAALARDDAHARLAFRGARSGEQTAEEPACDAAAEDADAAPHAEGRERREAPRIAYETRIIALGDEAARVLIGRDISLGGMRIESHPEVDVDDELRVGLHVGGREQPIVVNVRVVRVDGDRGTVLQFFDLDPDTQEHLARMIRSLPLLDAQDASDENGAVVCELIEDPAGTPAA